MRVAGGGKGGFVRLPPSLPPTWRTPGFNFLLGFFHHPPSHVVLGLGGMLLLRDFWRDSQHFAEFKGCEHGFFIFF